MKKSIILVGLFLFSFTSLLHGEKADETFSIQHAEKKQNDSLSGYEKTLLKSPEENRLRVLERQPESKPPTSGEVAPGSNKKEEHKAAYPVGRAVPRPEDCVTLCVTEYCEYRDGRYVCAYRE